MILARHAINRRPAGAVAPCLLMFMLLHAAPVRAAAYLEEVMGVLAADGINVTNDAIQAAAVDAILRAVDPRARIEPADTGSVRRATGPAIGPMETWANGIAYLPFAELAPGAGTTVSGMLSQASTTGVNGVILDLRETAGDDLDSVAAIASLFISPTNRPLFAVIEPAGERRDYRAIPAGLLPSRPTIVLIGARTGGATELLALLLRECPHVMLVGANTAGCGRLLSAHPLADGRRLMVPSRRLVFDGDRGFDGAGILPDIVVRSEPGAATNAPPKVNTGGKPLTAETAADQQILQRIGNDTTLKRAVDLLLGIKATHDMPHATSNAPAG